MYDLAHASSFLHVVDAGSVSAAAAREFTTQPTISRRIAALEQQVGARLFRRTPAGMTLTAAGRAFEPLARDLVRRARQADEQMRGVIGGRRAFLAAAPETTASYFLAPYIAQGSAIVDVTCDRPARVYERLADGADLAINTSRPPAGLAGARLVEIPIQAHVPPDHSFAGRETVDVREVIAEPFVMPGHGSAVGRAVAQSIGDWSTLDTVQLAWSATFAQARAAAGAGPALAIEYSMFGLTGVPVLDRGHPLVVPLYAGWESDHYAASELSHLAHDLAGFMRRRLTDAGLISANADHPLPG